MRIWFVKPGVCIPGFLKLFLFMYQYVCLCVCVSAPAGINNQWCDIGHVWLVKPVLQLFSLVTQHVMYTKQTCQSWHHTSHGRRHINYLAVATRWSGSVIKVSGWMHSDEFKWRLGFSFIVIRYCSVATPHSLANFLRVKCVLDRVTSESKQYWQLDPREMTSARYGETVLSTTGSNELRVVY